MMLSDRTIKNLVADGRLVIEPFEERHLQPASVDLVLGSALRVCNGTDVIDPAVPDEAGTALIEIEPAGYCLPPGELVLGSTIERVGLPDWIVGRVEGKSSLGRLGLMIHVTAGFIDPGFTGQVTLQLFNVSARPILLRPGMKIAQMSFLHLDAPAARPYGHSALGSRYQGQVGPLVSPRPSGRPSDP
jgi:dCTP deaminase